MEQKKTGISRRYFLSVTGAAIGGLAAGAVLGTNAAQANVTFNWALPATGEFTATVLTDIRKKGFDNYKKRIYKSDGTTDIGNYGCCYGAFRGIVDIVKDLTGAGQSWADYAYAKYDMSTWGMGGGFSWGTICGALNGAMMAVSLWNPAKNGVIADHLFSWYQTYEFPTTVDMDFKAHVDAYCTANSVTFNWDTMKSVCYSPLCHASVSTWCKASGQSVGSKQKSVRCGALTGLVAAKTVELMCQARDNTLAAFDFRNNVNADPLYTDCMDCHFGTGNTTADNGSIPRLDDEQGKMSCGQCHEDGGKNIAPGCTK